VNTPRTARDRVDRVFAVIRRMGRFAVLGVIVCVLGSAASVAYATLRKRTYKSEAMILYRDPDGARLSETALSRTRLEQIITSARLYGGIIADHGMPDAVDEMRKHVRLRQHEGDTFVLSFDDTNPQRAKDVTAQLADALVVDNARPVADPTPDAAKEAFDRERARLESELSRKEAALALFVSKHPEFSKEAHAVQVPPPRPAARPAPTAKNDSTLAMLERETQRLQERLAQPAGVRKEATADPALVAAKQSADAELAAAQRDLADKQANFTEQHPDVRAAREKVKAAQDKAKEADEAVAASLAAAQQKATASQEDEGYIDRGALENQLKRIQDEIAEYKRRKAENAAPTTAVASSVVAQEAEWTRLNRELTDVHDRLAILRDQEAKAPRVEAAPRTAQMAVIEPAYLPSHEEAPDHNQVLAAGLVATAVLALLVMLGLALIDDHIYDRVDIERMGAPLVGVVPRATRKAVKLG
jgi:capsular polysaccharide biosynthesis protein